MKVKWKNVVVCFFLKIISRSKSLEGSTTSAKESLKQIVIPWDFSDKFSFFALLRTCFGEDI